LAEVEPFVHVHRTLAKSIEGRALWVPNVLTNGAIVVKCGAAWA
jgi:hypothetical protein